MPITSHRQPLLHRESLHLQPAAPAAWTPQQPATPPGDTLPVLLPESERNITWAEFCQHYTAANGRPVILRKAFERICQPGRLADLDECTLTHFADTLTSEGWTAHDIRSRVPVFRAALKWGFDAGLIDPSRFNVERVPSPRNAANDVPPFRWQWRAIDGRPNYRPIRGAAA